LVVVKSAEIGQSVALAAGSSIRLRARFASIRRLRLLIGPL
jgi:hypothetical protein